jgi:hypothetical protein
MLFCAEYLNAQPCTRPPARAWLRVADTGAGKDTLWFGFDSTATYGIDPTLCETELPPIPPAGVFDARFVNIPGREGWEPPLGLGQGVKDDYRIYVNRADIDTHKVLFQPTVPPGYPIVLRWSPTELLRMCDSARLIDAFAGFFVNVRMQAIDSARVTNSAITNLLVIRYGQKPVPTRIPNVPVLVSPTNGATGQPASLTLVWTKSAQVEYYHVQLATDSNFVSGFFLNDSTVTDTTRPVSGLAYSTTYYWRVKAKNMLGDSGFTAKWRFTTQLQPPIAPTLNSPPNGTTNAPTTITFSWGPVSGAVTYRLQVATTSSFTPPLAFDDSTLTTPSQQVTNLNNNTTYYWHVNAKNAAGPGPYSSTWNFTTIVALPSAPTLSAPSNGATGISLTPTLSWNAASGASTYRLQVSTDTSFAVLVYDDSTINTTSRQIGPLAAYTVHYWRVRGKNTAGSGPYSIPRWSFTTLFVQPTPPTLTSPPNGQQNTPTTVNFTWTAVPGAIAHRLQVATDSTFAPGMAFDDSTITGTSRSVGPLANSTRYFWRVATKIVGGWGQFSNPFNFTTIVARPPAPTLQSPPNNQTNVTLNPTLSWSTLSTATTYHLQVTLDTSFSSFIVNDSTLTSTSRVVGPLTPGTNYYWRVRGKNIGGIGDFSTRFFFTTTATPPAPTLVYPTDSSRILPQTIRFVWNSSPSATRYRIEVATSNSFPTPLVFDDTTVTDTMREAGVFPNSARLWWRVRGRNASGWGVPSSPWVFWVKAQEPSAPALSSPSHNAPNVDLVGPLRWQIADRAVSYILHVALDTLVTNLIVADSGIVGLERYVRLAANTPYFWKVQGQNSEGTVGLWSSTRKFTTKTNAVPLPPITFSPANGDTNVFRQATLCWLVSPGTAKYWLQVALAANFSPPVVRDDSVTIGTSTCSTVGILQANTLHYWRVRARNANGWSAWSDTSRFTTGTEVGIIADPRSEVPDQFSLSQNYPNPFNPTTSFEIRVSGFGGSSSLAAQFVSVKVYDVLGREVSVLVNEEKQPGVYAVTWNGETDNREPLPSGMYFVRMVAVGGDGANEVFSSTKKVLLIK